MGKVKGKPNLAARNTGIVLKSHQLQFLLSTIQKNLVAFLNVGMKGSSFKAGGVQEVMLVQRGPNPRYEEAEVLIQKSVKMIESAVAETVNKKPNLSRGAGKSDVIELEDISSEDDPIVHRKENINGLEDISSDDALGDSKDKSGIQVICSGDSADEVCTVTFDKQGGNSQLQSPKIRQLQGEIKRRFRKDIYVLATTSICNNLQSKSADKAGGHLKSSNTILSEPAISASQNSCDDSLIIIENSPKSSKSTSCTKTSAKVDSTVPLPDDTIVISSCSESEDDILIEKVIKNKPNSTSKKKRKLGSMELHAASNTLDFIPLSHSAKSTSPSPSRKRKLRKISKFSNVSDGESSRTADLPCSSKNLRDASLVRGRDKLSKTNSSGSRWDQPPKTTDSSKSSGSKDKTKPNFDNNVISSDCCSPAAQSNKKTGLRPIIIDGQNIARENSVFNFRRLETCIKYFQARSHKVIAFLPRHSQGLVSDEEREKMRVLEFQHVLCFTPSRKLPEGKRLAAYDDRFIVQSATELGGVIVSNDNYRDLMAENPKWKHTIENRLLMYTWVDKMLMFPNDPLGRHGPHLDEFLRFPKDGE